LRVILQSQRRYMGHFLWSGVLAQNGEAMPKRSVVKSVPMIAWLYLFMDFFENVIAALYYMVANA